MRYGGMLHTGNFYNLVPIRSAEKCILRALNYLLFSLFTAAFLYLSFDGDFLKIIKYTILQNEKMWR